MAQGSSIEWTEATWNPVTGCTKVSAGCKNCLHPDTLVLYEDLTWRPLQNVGEGDVLVGFDEHVLNESGRGTRTIRPSIVTKVWRTTKHAIQVTTPQTSVICSDDHPFLAFHVSKWILPKNFTLSTKLRFIGVQPIRSLGSGYKRGYIAGITDGDGTFRYEPGQRSDKMGFKQCYWRVALADMPPLVRLREYCNAFGVGLDVRPFVQNNGHGYRKPMHKVETRSIPKLAVLHQLLQHDDDCPEFARGYLAGIFDAEGSFNGANLRISNNDLDILNRTVRYAAMVGLDFRIENAIPNQAMNARLYGPRRDRLAFFANTRPSLARKQRAVFDSSVDCEAAPVVRLESVGVTELIDIETTTHTFYANGLATHNCYAERMAKRLKAMGVPQYRDGFKLTLQLQALELPLKWRRPKRIFVNSMSDLFHEKVPLEFIQQVFDVMNRCPQHTFQILTKRPEIAAEFAPRLEWTRNIWMGTSVEDERVLWRVKYLREIPAKTRFLSLEPLIGPLPNLPLRGIHWVIVGGESGPKARPMSPDWVRDIRDRCQSRSVPFFFKQWGGVQKSRNGRELDATTWNQMPCLLAGWS